jgi:3-deoxy-D-manno-octulosonate 8-phosphate phosphatase (KDO 8-P phosphatase)
MQEIFEKLGGEFLLSGDEFRNKLKHIKAFVFDWDGVFNDGTKNENGSSPFSEVDSMGTNLLRFGWWQFVAQQMPIVAIISGERNASAYQLAQREHYHAYYLRIKHKIEALNHLCQTHGIELHEVAFFFDDALDLSIAERCGVRVLMGHRGSPLFRSYVTRHCYADYITSRGGGQHAVREACELLLGTMGIYDQTIDLRRQYVPDYEQYFGRRQAIVSQTFSLVDGQFVEYSF